MLLYKCIKKIHNIKLKKKGQKMTIKEYLGNKTPTTCAKWVERIHKDGLEAYESQIVACADLMGLILINENANFKDCINM